MFIAAVGVACASGVGDERVLAQPADFDFPSLPQFALRRVGRVPPFDPERFVTQRKSLKRMNRASLLAVAAARQLALPDGGSEAGLFLGVGMSGGEIALLAGLLDTSRHPDGTLDLAAMGREGLAHLHPLLSFHVLNNMPLCHVSIELGIGGPHAAIHAPGGEALQAFARGAEAVASGEAPWALSGGADAPLNTLTLALTDEDLDRPLAEGAAVALLSDRGAIEWLGLSEHRPQSIDAARAEVLEGEPSRWIAIGPALAGRGAIPLHQRVGETLAASGALAVALAVHLLRSDPAAATVGICAQDALGTSVAALRRAG